jgi:hypothetical protein
LDFWERLTAGNAEGARALLDFGNDHIPGFRNSFRRWILRAAMHGGETAGRLLKAAENALVELAVVRHRLTS